MSLSLPNSARVFFQYGGFLLLFGFAGMGAADAQNAILRLQTGDQISGVILSESTNHVVISNAWAGTLSVPVSEIISRRISSNSQPGFAPMTLPVKAQTNQLAGAALTNSPHLPAPGLTALSTNKAHAKWHGQINIGLDALLANTTQQDYYGKFKLTYLRPYQFNANKFFRNTTQVSGQYQRTDGQESANRANANNKTDFDLTGPYYGYSSAGTGYDDVRKIDFEYQVGPGLGRHIIHTDDTAVNLESGFEYEEQYRNDANNLHSFFLRLAQDWDWKIRKNLTLNEKVAFYPNVEPRNAGQYRFDFSSNLSYGFWQNLTLDLTVDDSYNTQVVQGVQRNEFEARISLGATF